MSLTSSLCLLFHSCLHPMCLISSPCLLYDKLQDFEDATLKELKVTVAVRNFNEHPVTQVS